MTLVEGLDRTTRLCRDYVRQEVTSEEICAAFASCGVLCVADERNLSSHAGQTALMTTISLLLRMGVSIGVEIPRVGVLKPQPPFTGEFLRDSVLSASNIFMPGASVQTRDQTAPRIVIAFGDSDVRMNGVPVWRLGGGDWKGELNCRGHAVPAFSGDWPIGAMVSATLAAGEVFKHVLRGLPFVDPAYMQFFEESPWVEWDFGAGPAPKSVISFGEVDVISAGAITQAALYCLLRLPHSRLRGRIFDSDFTDLSNLNRNSLSTSLDVGVAKVLVVSRRCSPAFDLKPVDSRFNGPEPGTTLAPRVLVGVDDIPSRWTIQRYAPAWVAVSGTSHMNVSSSQHNPNEPCTGCLHPVDDQATANVIPTVSHVSFWAGLSMAVRLIRETLGSPYPLEKQHLWLTPFRMHERHAAKWYPIPARRDCPVGCPASRGLPTAA